MDIVKSQVMELKKLWKNKRHLLFQGLNLAMIVFSALMIWKGLMVVTNSESPVVVVLRYAPVVHLNNKSKFHLLNCNLTFTSIKFCILVVLWSLHFREGISCF